MIKQSSKWKSLLIIIRNIIILLFILEFSLGFYFSLKTYYTQNKKINTVVDSHLYPNLKKDTVKKMFKELYNQEMQWESYTHYKFKPFNGEFNTIDQVGLRNTLNFSNDKKSKTYKIFCFGGSTLYGSGARDFYTIPSELSKLINKTYPNKRIEVTNFGCHGYIRSMENIALQKELLKGNIPDLVIFYDGVNDVVSAFQNNQAGEPTNSNNRKEEFNIGMSNRNKLQFLLSKSNINQLISKFAKPNTENLKTSEILAEEIVFNYFENIKISDAISNTYNFKILNFIQPHLFSKKHKIGIELTAENETRYYKTLFLKTYNLFSKQLQSNSKEVINISHVLNKYEQPFYIDFCHINEKGNKIMANEMFNIVRDSILKKPTNEN